MDKYLEIRAMFENREDKENALAMAKYMRNKFKFYGLPTPKRKEIYKSFLKDEKKNKIIDLAGQLSTLTEIKFKYSADGSIEKKFEVDGFEMDKILENMRIAQMQIVASYKSLEALGMIEITPAPKNRGKTLLGKSIQEFFS